MEVLLELSQVTFKQAVPGSSFSSRKPQPDAPLAQCRLLSRCIDVVVLQSSAGFVPLISRRLSAQCAKAAAVLIGLLSCLFRESVAGMKWDLWAGMLGLVMRRAAGGPDDDEAAILASWEP
ncbi:hypothetical protein VZT92_010807 [Zoarces viviparus]|uniref:Uncharacterized protein n=1 Tax=Zoarces viviparus TaxID=48416 RepID=A0AAW1F9V4_ZOAVI